MESKRFNSELIGKEALLIRMGGELGIKSKRTRRRMISLLHANIDEQLKENELQFTLFDFRGRILIVFKPPVIPQNIPYQIAQKISGISSLSKVFISRSKEEEILVNSVTEATKYIPSHSSFAVRVRREGLHPFSSMEIAAKIGRKILESNIPGLKVNLTTPQAEIFLDIRGELTFIYSEIIRGIDGIPSDSQGTSIALIRPNLNSIVAAWLMKKRGVKVNPVFFKTGKNLERTFIKCVEAYFSPVLAFIDLNSFFILFKNEKDLCFYCQIICETICKEYVSGGSAQTFISPTSFNYNSETITLDALAAIESQPGIVGLRPILFGYHGSEPLAESLDNEPCCAYRKKLEITLPNSVNKKKIELFLEKFKTQ